MTVKYENVVYTSAHAQRFFPSLWSLGVLKKGGVLTPMTPPPPGSAPAYSFIAIPSRECHARSPGGGGGRALRYWMTTHCQTATRSGGGERQNLGAVNPFEGKKRRAVKFKLRA